MRLIKRGISLEFRLWLQGLKRDAVTRLRVGTPWRPAPQAVSSTSGISALRREAREGMARGDRGVLSRRSCNEGGSPQGARPQQEPATEDGKPGGLGAAWRAVARKSDGGLRLALPQMPRLWTESFTSNGMSIPWQDGLRRRVLESDTI
jgi:hypothetical protein